MEVRSLITRTWENLNLLKELLKQGVKDPIREAALRWYIYVIHQNILDIVASIIAELNLRKPPTYSELAIPLYEVGLVNKEFVEDVKVIARNRNILAHEYRLSLEELIELAKELEGKAPKVLNTIIMVIEIKRVDPLSEEKLLRREIINLFKDYRDVIAVILFGSRARGTFTKDSDYDLAILSRSKLTIKQLNEIALKISDSINVPADKIDLIDLSKASNELTYKVIRDGKPLYVSDEEFLRRWIRLNYIRILDEESSLNVIYEVHRRKIERAIRS
ncbi:MAG TPA: DUF86 domain-containing protein [Acidilobales archaeon]|nr:DUF86 domain-containing protein [Acidilobales archaeon]